VSKLKKQDIKIVADHEVILGAGLANSCLGLPNCFDKTGKETLKNLLIGKLEIEGMLKHPLQLTHLTKIFSVN
jgi:hypothetical protein